jgi:hypothetical protein
MHPIWISLILTKGGETNRQINIARHKYTQLNLNNWAPRPRPSTDRNLQTKRTSWSDTPLPVLVRGLNMGGGVWLNPPQKNSEKKKLILLLHHALNVRSWALTDCDFKRGREIGAPAAHVGRRRNEINRKNRVSYCLGCLPSTLPCPLYTRTGSRLVQTKCHYNLANTLKAGKAKFKEWQLWAIGSCRKLSGPSTNWRSVILVRSLSWLNEHATRWMTMLYRKNWMIVEID